MNNKIENEDQLSEYLSNVDNISEVKDALLELGTVKFCEKGLDKTLQASELYLDDEEDDCIAHKSFDVNVEGTVFHITFYFGNNTGDIGGYNIKKI